MAGKKQNAKGYTPKAVQRRGSRSSGKPVEPIISTPPTTTLSNDELEKLIIFWITFDQRRLYGTDGELLPLDQLDDYTARTIAGIKVYEEYEGHGEDRKLAGYVKEFTMEKRLEAAKLLMKLRGLEGDMGEKTDRLGEVVAAMKKGPVQK